MQNGDIGGFEVADVCVEIFVHVFEDAAVFEGEIANSFDVLVLPFLKDPIINS